jgi:phage terminase large subunit-like protein
MLNLLPPEDRLWQPKYFTTAQNASTSDGPIIAAMSKRFLKARDGFKQGQPLELTEWQQWLVTNTFARQITGAYTTQTDVIMIPRKNGKTMLIAICVLYALLTGPNYAEIYSAAKDRRQAGLVFKMLNDWILESPALQARFKILIGEKSITNIKTKASYRSLSADAGGTNGINPWFIVADELHAWEANTTQIRAREFWGVLTTGSAAQKTSKMVVITTAGANEDNSILGELYKKGKRIFNGEEKDDSFGFYCWEADEGADYLDENTWIKANPNLAEGLLNIDYYRSQLKEKLVTGIHVFLRMYLNLWVSLSGEPYLDVFFWNKAIIVENATIPLGSKIVVGFDGSQNSDSTGIVIMDVTTGLFKIWEVWEKPVVETEGWEVNREEVEESMKRLHEAYKVELIWADEAYFSPDLRRWGNTYNWNVTIIAQTKKRMIPMGQEWKKDIAGGSIFHTDEPALSRHVKNALIAEDGAYIKDRKNSAQKIDLLVCSVLANGARRFLEAQEPMYVLRSGN